MNRHLLALAGALAMLSPAHALDIQLPAETATLHPGASPGAQSAAQCLMCHSVDYLSTAAAAGLLGGRGQEDGRRLWRAHRAGSAQLIIQYLNQAYPAPAAPPRSRPDREARGGPGPPAMPASRRTIGRPGPRYGRGDSRGPHAPTRFGQHRPARRARARWRPPCASAHCPLSFPAFRIIWIANLFANLGTWAQSVAAAWIITTEQSSPLLVAMIQVAAAFPLVALSILTGVLADNYAARSCWPWGWNWPGACSSPSWPSAAPDHADRLGLLHRHRQRRRDAGLAGGGGRTGAARVGSAVLLRQLQRRARGRSGHRRPCWARWARPGLLLLRRPDLGDLALEARCPSAACRPSACCARRCATPSIPP